MGGPYQIVGRIGSGGMAEVFLAKAIGAAGFEKTVAIKSILPAFTSEPRLTAKLIEEAKIATLLTHTNIVQVLDLGKTKNRYFIVMEYVDGADLHTTMTHSRKLDIALPTDLACAICRQVLNGLAFMNDRTGEDDQPLGLVHRDVSPPNILLSRAGEVKLADFGIAKARDRGLVTEAGVIQGKAGYMSPEQASGAKLDHRSDLFSLGVVLYELLAGEELFAGETQTEILEKTRQARVLPPSTINPDVPPALDEVVLQALAKQPKVRFTTARAFDAALQRAMQATPTPADLAAWLDRAMPPQDVETVPSPGDVLSFESIGAAGRGTERITPEPSPSDRRRPVRLSVVAISLSVGIVAAGFLSFPQWAVQPNTHVSQEPTSGASAERETTTEQEPAGTHDGTAEVESSPQHAVPTPATPPGVGTVFLNSEPWARIIIDGKDTGVTTPTVKGLRLPAGAHRITLLNPERELTLSVSIQVDRDQVIKRFFDLDRDGVQQ
ncbi:serine/threonine protein kinase [Myxococcota bacterium]